jgi:hypothetical protein
VEILNLDGATEGKSSAPKSRNRLRVISGIGAISVVIVLSSTLAANININSGPVEFGQGVAQTTTCDSNIFITPQSTFVNAEVNADFLFNSFSVTDISSACEGKTFTIKAYKNGQSSALDLYDSNGTIYSQISVRYIDGSFSFAGGGLLSDDIQNIASGFYVTIGAGTQPAFSLVSGRDLDRITIESKETVYSVGEIGPGGGIVFYYSEIGFQCGPTLSLTCRNLEAAPSDWRIGGDPGLSWATDTDSGDGRGNQIIGVPGAYGTAIGTGYKNSVAIVEQVGNVAESTAAVAARDYRGPNNLNDWYLPSQDELSQIYSKRTVVGVVEEAFYWSSTERYGDFAWAQIMSNGFGNEYQKVFDFAVRPVRAF